MKRLLAVLLVLSVVMPAVGTVGAQLADERAELAVEQPGYVGSDVAVDRTGNATTYRAEGERLLLKPTNFDTKDVVDFGVGQQGAELAYDERLDVYRFSPDAAATYPVFWTVEERREVVGANNTTSVETVRVRYSARINVSRTTLDHIPPSRLEQTRSDAQNWTAFESGVRSEEVAGPNVDMEQATQTAINLIRLQNNPLAALSGNFTQIAVLLIASLGGLLMLAVLIGWHAYSRYADVSELRERRQLDSERADLEQQLEDLETKETLATLEGMDWNHLFPDDVARAFREAFGETVLDGWLRLQAALEPRRLVRDRLQAMSDDFVAVTDREVTMSDGGADASPETDVSATLYPHVESPEDAEDRTHDLTDPPEWLVDAVDWADPELRQFDLTSADLDHEDLDTQLESPTVEEIVERHDIQLERDFDGDKEQFAQYLAEFFRSVADHDISDAKGQPRRIRVAANVFLRASRILRDRHQFPGAAYPAEHWELVATEFSTEDEVAQYVSDVQSGRIGGD
jgi:hypothetical protein